MRRTPSSLRRVCRPQSPAILRSFSRGRVSDFPRLGKSFHTSPTLLMRAAMFFSVNEVGATFPFSISVHVQGADTGAPALALTVYAAANVAL